MVKWRNGGIKMIYVNKRKISKSIQSRKIETQFTFDIGKSAIKLFLSVMQINGKLLLSVNTGYKLRNFARTTMECSLKFNV